MRTSIEIPDPLFNRVRSLAQRRGTTMRSIVEDGLRKVLDEEQGSPSQRVKIVTYGRGGIKPEFAEGGWKKIAEEIYPEESPGDFSQ